MASVTCERCGTEVMVKKQTLAHTIVQWTSSTDRCAELSAYDERGRIPTCLELRGSIDAAVRDGGLVVESVAGPTG